MPLINIGIHLLNESAKLKIKLRYHNGTLVDFGQFEYSFMLEFNLLKSQQERSYSIRNAFDLSQLQSINN